MTENAKGNGHPYRDAVVIIEEVSKRPSLARLVGTGGLVVELKHALDDGIHAAVLADIERTWLADRLRDMEANANLIRNLATPLTIGFGTAAAALLSYGVLGSLAKLPHGAAYVTAAVSFGVVFAFYANKTRQWNRIADDIDAVVKDLRAFCRTMEIVPQKTLEENAARRVDEAFRALVREEVDRGVRTFIEGQASLSGVRVDHPVEQTETAAATRANEEALGQSIEPESRKREQP